MTRLLVDLFTYARHALIEVPREQRHGHYERVPWSAWRRYSKCGVKP